MTATTIHHDGQGGFIAGGLPDGRTKHVRADNVTVTATALDSACQPLGEMEFLVPTEDLRSMTPLQLARVYGEMYFAYLQNSVKRKGL